MASHRKQPETFLWHDYETFGANPMADRPAQFAALRTNLELNPVADPVVWYCAPADDVLPHPMASLITGITPQEAREKGEPETVFAQHIHQEMMQHGTCSAGYNSIRFDDVFSRNLFYRNLRDPYEREYKNGNSRWDLIDLARMCYALRPDGIEWPMHEPGKPSFKLEDLSAVNGIEHAGAHDALADVRATIDLARLIRAKQPRLFEWGLGLRKQATVAALLDPTEPKPILHSSARIPAVRGCTAMILPLAVPPDRPKAVIAIDLSADPEPLLHEPADVLYDLVFTAAKDLPEEVERLPLKLVHSNHVPMIAPPGTLKGVDTQRIGLDPEQCYRNARKILPALASIRNKVIDVFAHAGQDFVDSSDPDRMLYSGSFFSPADRHLLNKILGIAPADLGRHLWSFQDDRLQLMLFRYRARNFPETLNLEEERIWEQDKRARLVETMDPDYFTRDRYKQVAAQLREERQGQVESLQILDKLDAWLIESGIDRL
ncbi:MAG: exodeoxyribonuclease I [Xanthomonadales bacterium]|nr:exodeoxyribonuclease I [Xanthomonadales bacterium]